MSSHPAHTSRPHLRGYLVIGYMIFIAYVSLVPFNWQDQGLNFSDVLAAPLMQTFTWFDFNLNLFSYLVFGFLLTSLLHLRWHARKVIAITTACGLLLSASMEYLQMYLPTRFSSNTDILSNTLGTLLGAMLLFLLIRFSINIRFRELHYRWFKHGRIFDFGLALIALWIFAQSNPSLPMLGSVFIREVARWPFDIVPAKPFSWLEASEVALNLLLTGILLSTLLRERRHTFNTLLLMLGGLTLVKFIAAAMLLKSWALLIWLDGEAMLGIASGLILLVFILRLPHGKLLFTGYAASLLYLLLLQDTWLDNQPSTVRRLFHWHYIHLLNYNGFSQLVVLLFPLLMLVYLWRTGVLRK